ncbi:outer membrane protein with beta-barrel domain [Breznakibacter xylanolyticus]|uniref:Outer membrane protein with beta-barrel domain n=1 Tax=Breznakibacter xylanolyticus TaxID=990 RepID=A0A2W7Q411_9BACT|nr:porin family protein [Breznakibacter xylanolyticus]PZX16399.1 outer membrane protein with beta-barrel domain [Breznakibacter xylanolyticus]
MKKLIFTAAVAMMAFAAQAQTSFGVTGGINFQNLNGEEAGEDTDNKLKTGFLLGVNAEIAVADDFYFQPGLQFAVKGAKGDNDTKINLNYLEVPLNFLYKPLFGDGHLILGFGPYLAYGIGGKVKNDSGEMDIEFKSDVKESDDDNKMYVAPFDAGANIFFGYEFSNRLSFQLNTQLGFINIVPKYDGEKPKDTSMKNTGFGFSVGYRF